MTETRTLKHFQLSLKKKLFPKGTLKVNRFLMCFLFSRFLYSFFHLFSFSLFSFIFFFFSFLSFLFSFFLFSFVFFYIFFLTFIVQKPRHTIPYSPPAPKTTLVKHRSESF